MWCSRDVAGRVLIGPPRLGSRAMGGGRSAGGIEVEGSWFFGDRLGSERARKSREIVPQGLDGNVRVRGGTPAHAAAPSGLPGSSGARSADQHPLQRLLRANRPPTGTGLRAIAGAGRGVSRRHHSDGGVDGRADAATEPAGNDGPPGRCRTNADPRHSDGEAARFGPRDSGSGETTGMEARRLLQQLRRSRDWTPLQFTTYDRDRPHPAVCPGRRCRSREPQAGLPSPSPPSACAARLTAHS